MFKKLFSSLAIIALAVSGLSSITPSKAQAASNGTYPVYRLANWMTHERLFTTDAAERDNAVAHLPGWVSEGTAFYGAPSTDSHAVPVYRLANWMTHERLFTTDAAERDNAVAHLPGWVSEGTAFFSTSVNDTTTYPVYRLANWMTHERLFTTDAAERDNAVAHLPGWVSEGTAFYGVNATTYTPGSGSGSGAGTPVVPPVIPPVVAGNLIPNPSAETATGTAPTDWTNSNWGTNTTVFSYLNTGHTGSHSLKVDTTAYTDGASNWYYTSQPVIAGATYLFSNYYQSTAPTTIEAQVTMSDNSLQYFQLVSNVPASTGWAQATAQFTAPVGAVSATIYQSLNGVGSVTTDDYSLTQATAATVGFTRPIVSVSFDDGWANQYTNAYPFMKSNGLVGTYNIISGSLADQPDYMTAAQVKDLFTNGNEIASHSITHPDFTTLTQAQMTSEFADSQTTLQNLIGVPVTDFAYPYGAYNPTTLATGAQYYQSQRSVDAGYNTKADFNIQKLKIYEVDSNISQATVKSWIDGAVANHVWLILLYHEVATTPAEADDALYTAQPADFQAEMTYLKGTGAAVETVHQALTEILPQLGK